MRRHATNGTALRATWLPFARHRPLPGGDFPEREVAWHAQTADAVLRVLGTSEAGLDDATWRERLARFGPNRLSSIPPEPAWRILIAQLYSVVVLLLAAGVVIALVSGDAVDAIAIGVVLALNVAIGFATELRARRAMEALVRLDVPHADVVRNGQVVRVDAGEIVVGDVLELEGGQTVAADARLLWASELRAVEAPLTGESVPVEKRADAVLEVPAPLGDRINMVFKGTAIANGSARAVVVATGAETEVGRIGTLTGGVQEQRTVLERRLDALGRRLALVAVGVGALVALVALFRGAPASSVLELAIAVAVAAVPEGLPAVVTITMAIGVRRMARRNALVRRLPVVETLGSATVVCTDKTGTLTTGEQTVVTICLPDDEVTVTGESKMPVGEFLRDGRTIAPLSEPHLASALRIGVLANRATLLPHDGGWQSRGDPTEIALLVAAQKAGMDRDALRVQWPEIGNVPFSSDRMLMATFHSRADGAVLAAVKGAPSRVLAYCTLVATSEGEVPLDEGWRARIDDRVSTLASRGLRVLALASGRVAAPDEHSLDGGAITFAGLVGITDPPAPGVRETIRLLRGAGIQTVMLTGDHRDTATAIARDLELLGAGERAAGIEGRELDRLTDDEVDERLRAHRNNGGATAVFSRVSPEAKLRLVRAMQAQGDIVAMIGDGINDAAALKQADIGVAMGRRGTDVAKEVAGIVLADDRFATIAAAVEEGRVVFENIRKFVFYLFSCNIAEVIVLLGAGLVGLPLPVTALQILWLNLVTDTLPALALAAEPADRGIMQRPPREPGTTILSGSMLRLSVFYSLLIVVVTLLALWWGERTWPNDLARAVTLSFSTLALAQLFHLGNARSRHHVAAPRSVLTNRWAVYALIAGVALQVIAVTWTPLARVLDTRQLPATAWLLAFGLALVPAIVGQGVKFFAEVAARHR